MKITEIETFVVDAGWRPWQFVAVRTDEGITGYGEVSDGRTPYGIVGTITDMEPILIGRDPLAVEARYWDMYRMVRQSPGGIGPKAIAGVELALWDIKGKALGVPVYSLFGGPTRDDQQIYWSHCGSSRARHHELLGAPPLRTMDDVTALGDEVRSKGFNALKTNIVFPGDPASTYGPGFGGPPGTTDQNVTPALLRHVREYISAFKAGARPRRPDRAGHQLQLQAARHPPDLRGARGSRDDVGRDRHVRAGRRWRRSSAPRPCRLRRARTSTPCAITAPTSSNARWTP